MINHRHRPSRRKEIACIDASGLPRSVIAFALITSLLTTAAVVSAIVGAGGDWEWRFALSAIASAVYAFSWLSYKSGNQRWGEVGLAFGTTIMIYGWF
jgi:hypothetical protein